MAHTIRNARERLSERAGTGSFDRTLMKMHARSILASALAFPLLTGLIAIAGFAFGMGLIVLVWAALSNMLYLGVILVARHVDRVDEADVDVIALRRLFLAAHVVGGLGWAWLAMLDCASCGIDQLPVIKAVLILLSIAATAIVGSALKGALLASFVVPVAAYAAVAARSPEPATATMLVLLVASLPFFSYVSRHLYQTTVMLLSFRTEKDALIAQLETANAMSHEARRRAEEANLAKSRFLATMSHELRTPLNAILGFSEVMANEILGPIRNETYRDYARDIHGSGSHLLNLINEILDLSRIEAGRYQIKEEEVSLTEIADASCHMLEMKIRGKDIRLLRQYESELPLMMADERLVRQVILNLLSNAVKFTPAGGEITVKVGWTSGGGQYVSVRDNGPGIDADEIPVVLSAFGQGSIAIKNAEQGTGLGLPIVQAILRMHGGRFDLRSRLREGTEAIASFPAARVLAPKLTMPARPVDTDPLTPPQEQSASLS